MEDLLRLGIRIEWMVEAEHRQAYLQQPWPGRRSFRSDSDPSSSTQIDLVQTLLEGSLGRPYVNAPGWHKSIDLTIYQSNFYPIAMTAPLELRELEAAVHWPSYITKPQYATLLQELGAENIDTQNELRFGPMKQDGKLYKYEWTCLDLDLLGRHAGDETLFTWNVNITAIKCTEDAKKYDRTPYTAKDKS